MYVVLVKPYLFYIYVISVFESGTYLFDSLFYFLSKNTSSVFYSKLDVIVTFRYIVVAFPYFSFFSTVHLPYSNILLYGAQFIPVPRAQGVLVFCLI